MGLLLPKLRRQIAEFLQRHSLKRLSILCQSTCVGFGYGLMRGLFPGTPSKPTQSVKGQQHTASVTTRWPTIINVVPIDYAFRPRLRGRLTLRRLTLRRNPWTFGDAVFHSVSRYSCQHSHFRYLQRSSRILLRRPTERSATAQSRDRTQSFGSWLEPRYIFGADTLKFRPVSCYAFFKGWLLLSQPPGCFGMSTSFHTEPRIGGLSCWSGLFPSPRRTLAPAVCLPTKFTGIRSLVRFGKAVSPPSPSSALPPVTYSRGST